MAEQDMLFLAWNGWRGSTAVPATCSFCPDFAHSLSHQIFTQRRGKPCDVAREERKGGAGRGFCLPLAGEKGAALGQLCWGPPCNSPLWGLCLFCGEANSPPARAGKAKGHTDTPCWWRIWWGEIAASGRSKVQTITLKEVLNRPCRGWKIHLYQEPLKKHE